MKKVVLTTGLISFCLLLLGQNKHLLPNQYFQFNMGRSKHGSGDIIGISFNSAYTKYFKNHFSWIVDVGGSLHDGSESLFFNAPNGEIIDGSIRYTTGGIQSTFGVGYSPIRTDHHEFQIRLSGLFRYQSSSLPDIYTILYPALTGLPIPVLYFENTTPQRTFSIGGFGSIAYNHTVSKNITIGFLTGLQTDTNGDTIWQLSLSIGKRF